MCFIAKICYDIMIMIYDYDHIKKCFFFSSYFWKRIIIFIFMNHNNLSLWRLLRVQNSKTVHLIRDLFQDCTTTNNKKWCLVLMYGTRPQKIAIDTICIFRALQYVSNLFRMLSRNKKSRNVVILFNFNLSSLMVHNIYLIQSIGQFIATPFT